MTYGSFLAAAAVLFSPGIALAQPAPAANAAPHAVELKLPRSAACVITKVVVCKLVGCTPVSTLGETPLPAKITVDFRNRMILSVDKDGYPVGTPIASFVGADKQLILQGVEGGVGWVMNGSSEDNDVTFTLAAHNSILSGFGTCELDDE